MAVSLIRLCSISWLWAAVIHVILKKFVNMENPGEHLIDSPAVWRSIDKVNKVQVRVGVQAIHRRIVIEVINSVCKLTVVAARVVCAYTASLGQCFQQVIGAGAMRTPNACLDKGTILSKDSTAEYVLGTMEGCNVVLPESTVGRVRSTQISSEELRPKVLGSNNNLGGRSETSWHGEVNHRIAATSSHGATRRYWY